MKIKIKSNKNFKSNYIKIGNTLETIVNSNLLIKKSQKYFHYREKIAI